MNPVDKEKTVSQKSSPNVYYALLGLARRKRAPNGKWSFELLYKRIFCAIIFAVIVLWIFKSLFIYAFFNFHKDYSSMSLWNSFIFPVNLSEVRVEQGENDINDAKEYIKSGKWSEAYVSLSKGVTRSPKNIEGRQMLAEFDLTFARRPDIAIKHLEGGLLYGANDIRFMRLYLRLLIEQHEDAKIIKIANALLDKKLTTNPEVVAYVAMAASTIYALHGNYTLSKDMLVNNALDKSLPGIMRLSKNEWEQGNSDVAIKIITDNFNSFDNKTPFYAILSNYYLSLKDYDKAMKYSTLRAIEDPFSLEQRVDRLTLLYKVGNKDLMRTELNSYISQYAKNDKGMLLLANLAAEMGDIELMRKIYDISIQRNFQIAPYCLLLMETMICNGMYQEASDFAESIIKERPFWLSRFQQVFSCLRAVAYYALGNSNMADVLINDVISTSSVPSKVLLATARRFESLNAPVLANKILESVVEKYPRNQQALSKLIQMEVKTGNSTNLEKHIYKLMQMRRPQRKLLEDARNSLGSDRFIFVENRKKIFKEIDILMKDLSNSKLFIDYQDDDNSRIMDESDRILD